MTTFNLRVCLCNLLLVAATLLAFTACETIAERGNGVMTTETYDVEAFSRIDTRGNYSIVLEEGNEEQVIIEADENLQDYITVRVSGSKLIIENEEPIFSEEGITVSITYKAINELSCAGASAVSNRSTLRSNDLELKMSGAGAFDLDVNTDYLRIDISGAGAIDLAGQTEKLVARLSGAGALGAFDLIAVNADVNLSGIGGITYRGNPNIRKNVSGVGVVERD